MKLNKEHAMLGAVVIGGVILVYYLRGAPSATPAVDANTNPEDLSTQIPAQQSLAQSYPNAGVSPDAGVTIGGSPLYISYNTPGDSVTPPVTLAAPPTLLGGNNATPSGSGCGDCGCEDSNTNVNWLSQNIAIVPSVIQSQLDNLRSVFVGVGG